MTAFSAKKIFRLDAKTMRSLPTLHSLPGKYAMRGKGYRRRFQLVRLLDAATAAGHPHGTDPKPSPQFSGIHAHRFMAIIRIPVLNRLTGCLDWGVSCRACHYGPGDKTLGYRAWTHFILLLGTPNISKSARYLKWEER